MQSIQGNLSTRPDIIAAMQIELKEIHRHNLTVTFEMVPAYVGIIGNETTDFGSKTGLAIKGMLTNMPLGINKVIYHIIYKSSNRNKVRDKFGITYFEKLITMQIRSRD